jgi:adenine C2-methylase RlmN of 23S rRNA A2503 and tRNA A37
MTPNSASDKFRQNEIEQQLASELHTAREQTRRASTEGQKRVVLETYLLALQRYTEFAAKRLVPADFLRQSHGSH